MPRPLPSNFTSFGAWLDYSNTVTDFLFGNMLIVALWFVFFIPLKERFPGLQSAVAANLIVTIIAIIMRTGGWVSDYIMYLGIIITMISIALLYSQN